MRSLRWLQRGCGTSGLTLAQKSYSWGRSVFQNVAGCWEVSSIRTMDLALLKPYFHGTTIRTGAPCCFSSGWPYIPVARNASSLVASASVRPSVYGHGSDRFDWRPASAGRWKVTKRTYRAEGSGSAARSRAARGNPVQGTTIAHV